MRIGLFGFIFLHGSSKHLGADNDLYSAFKDHGDVRGGRWGRHLARRHCRPVCGVILPAVAGEDPVLLRFALQQVDGSNMLFVFYHITDRIGELSSAIAAEVFKLVDRRGLEHRKRGAFEEKYKNKDAAFECGILVFFG